MHLFAMSQEKMVYLISNPAWPGWYKIGVALNWKKRWNSYQTGSPFRDYKFEYGRSTENWEFVEKAMISRYKSINEWVYADLEDLKRSLNNMV